ncbi:MAG: response regulator [Terriglobia bacterium]
MSTVVLGLVDDLFFTAKIQATASQCGVSVRFSSQAQDLMNQARDQRPSLILVDLSREMLAPMEAIQRLKEDPLLREIPVLGFYSHVEARLKDQALQAGCNRVVPRSYFSQNLAAILTGGI